MNVSTATTVTADSATTIPAPLEPTLKRRHSPLLAATRLRRGLPGPASATTRTTATPRCTPVPTPAHGSSRAIRVRRSPR